MRPFVILTIVSLFAVAQADPSSGTPAVTPTPSAGSDAGSASGSGEIAPPAPDANPKKVQEAKDIAKTADLTPILPSPSNPTKPAYLLYAELDPPILATGLVFIYGRSYKVDAVYCAPVCDKNGGTLPSSAVYPSLNPIDKLAAGRPRPFMYGTAAPMSLRESGNGGLSFISSHTSEAFALVTSLYVTEHRRHPDATWPYY